MYLDVCNACDAIFKQSVCFHRRGSFSRLNVLWDDCTWPSGAYKEQRSFCFRGKHEVVRMYCPPDLEEGIVVTVLVPRASAVS